MLRWEPSNLMLQGSCMNLMLQGIISYYASGHRLITIRVRKETLPPGPFIQHCKYVQIWLSEARTLSV